MRFLLVAAATVILLCGIAAGLRLYLGRAAENRVEASEDVSIRALRPPLPQNGFLACPPGYCAVAEAAPAPVFDMPETQLRQCWERMIAAEPRLVGVAAAPARDRIVYVQRTPWLRFPDIVTVEFVGIGADRSSVAIYSRARYGRRDFGTNRRRVADWLARLATIRR